MSLALGFALLIGASLALFGAGGSIVTVPVLVYVLGMDAHAAAGTSLVVVGLVALAGAVAQWRTASLRTGIAFGLAGMLGALPGAWLNHHVPAPVVLIGFGATMLAAAGRMGLKAHGARHASPAEVAPVRAILLGVGVGVATGFFGVGGGFLIVPALTLFLGVPIRRAVATSLVVIALNSFAGLAAHVAYGGVEWRLGSQLTLAALVGAAVTLPVAKRLSGPILQRGFAGALAVLGVAMVVQTVRGLLA
jgi:uncharacterized membrane protein YfcA